MCVAQNCVDGDVTLRHGQLCTQQYDVTPQRTVLFIVTAVPTARLEWNAGHIVLVHFEDTFPSIKSKVGVVGRSRERRKSEKKIGGNATLSQLWNP